MRHTPRSSPTADDGPLREPILTTACDAGSDTRPRHARSKKLSAASAGIAATTCGLLLLASGAPAAPSGVSVVGVVGTTGDDPFTVAAYGGPNGQLANGTLYGQQGTLGQPGTLFSLERVVCISVKGNLAVVGTQVVSSDRTGLIGTYDIAYFKDNDSTPGSTTPDQVNTGFLGSTHPNCGVTPELGPGTYVTTGDITITGG